jgi:hypothetical protein
MMFAFPFMDQLMRRFLGQQPKRNRAPQANASRRFRFQAILGRAAAARTSSGAAMLAAAKGA